MIRFSFCLGLLFSSWIFFQLGSTQSAASEDSPTYCAPNYTDVDKIYLWLDATIPTKYRNIDVSAVTSDVMRDFKHLIVDNTSIEVVVSTGLFNDRLENEPHSVGVRLVYSFVDADAFTEPLQNEGVAIWLELSRYTKTETADKIVKVVDRYPPNFFVLPASINAIWENPMTYGSRSHINNFSCMLLASSTDKICTDSLIDGMKQVIDSTRPCIRAHSNEHNLIKTGGDDE